MVVYVCVLCILGEVLSSFTLHCCGEVHSKKVVNTETMLRAHVISQQTHRLLTPFFCELCHTKKLDKNCIYQKY